MSLRSFFVRSATLFAGLSFGAKALATLSVDSSLDSASVYDFTAFPQSDSLRLAYWILYPGNHVYGGHRASAMLRIQSAAKLLGVDISGDGSGGEDQIRSDARLQLARQILETVLSQLNGDQKALRGCIHGALTDIYLCQTSFPLVSNTAWGSVPLNDTDKQSLQLAYAALMAGKHNYRGHRQGAMYALKSAGILAGLDLKGDQEASEEQSRSDARLTLTQKLLQDLRSRLTADWQQPVAAYVDRASQQLCDGVNYRASVSSAF